MGERGPTGRTPRRIRRLGAHGSDLQNSQRIEFGSSLPKSTSQPETARRRKLTQEEVGEGFFPDPALKNPRRIEIPSDPEHPLTYVWVKPDSFSTAPINSDAEDHGGTLEARARIASPGKKLKFVGYGGIGSFTGRICEVTDDRDIWLLGKSGWWTRNQLSEESKPTKTPQKSESDKLF